MVLFFCCKAGMCKCSVWGEEATWKAIMMEEERQESDCDVTEGSRQSTLPENLSGVEWKKNKPAVNVWQLLLFCRVTWAFLCTSALRKRHDGQIQFYWLQQRWHSLFSSWFTSHHHLCSSVLCVKLILMDFFFFFLYFNKTVVCFHRKWTVQEDMQRLISDLRRGSAYTHVGCLNVNTAHVGMFTYLTLVHHIFALCISKMFGDRVQLWVLQVQQYKSAEKNMLKVWISYQIWVRWAVDSPWWLHMCVLEHQHRLSEVLGAHLFFPQLNPIWSKQTNLSKSQIGKRNKSFRYMSLKSPFLLLNQF